MKTFSSILVIDDNESDHIIANFAIQEYDSNIIVHKAYDGDQALTLLTELDTPPDLILLDINMPGMDGHEFLKQYANEYNQVSVVAMLTTSDQIQDKKMCMECPFVKEYITKPIEASDLGSIASKI